MPTATDLVTDLPADFEVFGQAVATSMADLLGGTSGQVLAKNSNTDMDFVWVAQDDSNAIQNAIVDAKGDLIAASAADTPARLAVGSNGETLVADSSTSTGLRYQVPVNVNPVLNSSFQVWQRGTSGTANSFAAGAGYNADRWQNYYPGTLTVSRQATGDTTNLPFIQYCARVQRNAGQTNTGGSSFGQSIETVNSIPFAGKTVTYSYYARAGANYSATSNALGVFVDAGTGTDQNVFTGYTGSTRLLNATTTLTTSWQRFTHTFAVASTYTQLGLLFTETPTGTAGANDYFEITGVQLEIGSVATPFKTNGATIQGELAACQRYYYRQSLTTAAQFLTGLGIATSTTVATIQINNPVPLRTVGTSIDYANVNLYDGVLNNAATGAAIQASTLTSTVLGVTSTGLTQFRPYWLLSGTTNSFIGIGAEL
jgi:hypothetical protein